MSYNNWLDMDAAWGLAQEFDTPTVCIIKHTNPCGVASAASLAEAYPLALASDPVSAFGGIIALNRTADLAMAEAMADLFVEVVIAPDYTEEALAKYRRKANLRILRAAATPETTLSLRTIQGGLLAQIPDVQLEPAASWQVVTQRQPTADELDGLDFAWRVAKHVKSNAIVLVKGEATVGVGAGQMSRVELGLPGGAAGRRAGQRLGVGLRRLLPLPRRRRGGRGRRRHGSRAAGRLDARSRRDRRLRPAGAGHVFHGSAAFPALGRRSQSLRWTLDDETGGPVLGPPVFLCVLL